MKYDDHGETECFFTTDHSSSPFTDGIWSNLIQDSTVISPVGSKLLLSLTLTRSLVPSNSSAPSALPVAVPCWVTAIELESKLATLVELRWLPEVSLR